MVKKIRGTEDGHYKRAIFTPFSTPFKNHTWKKCIIIRCRTRTGSWREWRRKGEPTKNSMQICKRNYKKSCNQTKQKVWYKYFFNKIERGNQDSIIKIKIFFIRDLGKSKEDKDFKMFGANI